MKLADIFEVTKPFSNVTHTDPSGLSGGTPVKLNTEYPEPEELRYERLGKRNPDRSKKIRQRYKFVKNQRSPSGNGAEVKGDNTDLTGSGPHSAVNGPYNY